MSKGFSNENLAASKVKESKSAKQLQGRLISWSPWPPADFQTRYPAFPFVLTLLIIIVGQWYFSLLR
tara:strand:- start:398 stop:598 length:201 start_codon:yes stop_codon:yes gene_type:complete